MCPSEQPTWTIQIAGTNDFWLQMLHHLMFCDHLGSLVGCQAGAGNLVRRFKLIPIVGRERGCMSQSITLENKNSRTWNEQLRWWMLVNRLLLNGLWTICEQYQIHVGYCWLLLVAQCCKVLQCDRVQASPNGQGVLISLPKINSTALTLRFPSPNRWSMWSPKASERRHQTTRCCPEWPPIETCWNL